MSKGLVNSTILAGKAVGYGISLLGNLYEKFDIYSLCPRRFQDWIKDNEDAAGKVWGFPERIRCFSTIEKYY